LFGQFDHDYLLWPHRTNACATPARRVQHPALAGKDCNLSVVCLVPTGMIVGLLTIFLLRGTKGALLTPVADVVQVENPYGIAFACSVAAMFSDQIIAWLSKLVGALPARGPQQSEPG